MDNAAGALAYLNANAWGTVYDGNFTASGDTSPSATGDDPSVGGCFVSNCATSALACLGGETGGSVIIFQLPQGTGNLYILGEWNDPSNNYTYQRSCTLANAGCNPCTGSSYTLPVPPVDLYNQVSADGHRTYFAQYYMYADSPTGSTITRFGTWSDFLADCPTDSNCNPAACVTLPSPCSPTGDPFFGDDPP
jgi:hypothetical protein